MRARTLFLLTTALLAAPAAHAIPVAPYVGMAISINGDMPIHVDAGLEGSATLNDDGTSWSFTGSYSDADITLDWDLDVDADPFVTGVVGLTNNSGSTQNYTFTTTLGISPAFSPAVMGANDFITVLDANFDGGATMATVGAAPLFTGQIDGADVLPLFGNPYTLTCAIAFAGCGNSDSDIAGLPGPTIPYAPGVASTIGIKHVFSLTKGDQATFNAIFVVEPVVPEPAVALLLGIGLPLFAALRRRS